MIVCAVNTKKARRDLSAVVEHKSSASFSGNSLIMERCFWVNLRNPVYVNYHDEEWGRPCHDDKMLYELLILECFQAGLSWECILNKRENYRRAYAGFDLEKVLAFDEEKIQELLADGGIVRNRRKILASLQNSRVFKEIQGEYGSFNAYIWHFTAGATIKESCAEHTTSELSDTISRDLKRRGMAFVGSTTIYSYLQAIGVINGHTQECQWRGLCEASKEQDESVVTCQGCECECQVSVGWRNGERKVLGGNNCPTGEQFALSQCRAKGE